MPKEPCRYGAKCFRKNPDHLREFSHPTKAAAAVPSPVSKPPAPVKVADQSPSATPPKETKPVSTTVVDSDSDSEEEPTQSATVNDVTSINGVKPLKVFKEGEYVEEFGYKIKRTGDHYYCTCIAWKMNSRHPVNARTCKHLRLILGDAYEDARLKWKNPFGSSTTTSPQKRSTATKKRSASDDDEDSDSQNPKKKSSSSKSKKKDDDDDTSAADRFTAKNRAKRDEIKAKQPALLLAEKYDPSKTDPTGWWVSEKLDGVRAFWDHEQQEFYSRLGNIFTAPDWFKEAMPKDLSLDGELFGGRGKFSETVSVVKTINSPHWKKVDFQIFDSPSLTKKTFEDRIEHLKQLVSNTSASHLKILAQEKVKNKDHVTTLLAQVESKGGEGLMLRQPKSLYVGKRSTTLLKVKSFYDAEAIVVGYEAGKGRNASVTGSLKCKMQSGKEFKIGTGLSDAERKKPPAIGAIVTYRFQELTTDGVPRFPSYVGVRVDADKPCDAKVRTVTKQGDE
ncbi:hypothetical protein HDU80_009211 [Chytriomyces hyalinus]|nr:hypothetical protein HDU80_009211 [Chytriomyces hyalinus]